MAKEAEKPKELSDLELAQIDLLLSPLYGLAKEDEWHPVGGPKKKIRLVHGELIEEENSNVNPEKQ